MKKVAILIVLALMFSFTLTACKRSSNSGSSNSTPPTSQNEVQEDSKIINQNESSVQDSPQIGDDINLQDTDALFKKYFANAADAGIISSSWQQPTEINPHFLINLYLYHWLDNNDWDFTEKELRLPAKDVELFLNQRFDWNSSTVDINDLRSQVEYDATDDSFICNGIGASLESSITSAKFENDDLVLSYETYSREDDKTVLWSGELAVKIENESFRYISNNRLE